MFSVHCQHIDRIDHPQFPGVKVATLDRPVEQVYDDLFVRRGWGACFHGEGLTAEALRVNARYVMLSNL
jgi:hypothetical protein